MNAFLTDLFFRETEFLNRFKIVTFRNSMLFMTSTSPDAKFITVVTITS